MPKYEYYTIDSPKELRNKELGEVISEILDLVNKDGGELVQIISYSALIIMRKELKDAKKES